jgi:hypothetical protein
VSEISEISMAKYIGFLENEYMPELTTVELVSGLVGLTVVLCFLKLTIAQRPTTIAIKNSARATGKCAGQLKVRSGDIL